MVEGAYDVAGVTVASKNDEQSAAPERVGKEVARTAERYQYRQVQDCCSTGLPRRQASALQAEVVVTAATAAARPQSTERVEKRMPSSLQLKNRYWAGEGTRRKTEPSLQIVEELRKSCVFIRGEDPIP